MKRSKLSNRDPIKGVSDQNYAILNNKRKLAMKYLVLLVQLAVSILISFFLIGVVAVYVAPNLLDMIPGILFVVIHLSIIYLFMKATAKIARKLGLPTVNIKGM